MAFSEDKSNKAKINLEAAIKRSKAFSDKNKGKDGKPTKKRLKALSGALNQSKYKTSIPEAAMDHTARLNEVNQAPTHNLTKNTTQIRTTQADRVIARFGGPKALKEAIESVYPDVRLNISTIYRWTYKKGHNSGTGGVIPPDALRLIINIARICGVLLTERDLHSGVLLEDARYLRKIGEFHHYKKHGIKFEHSPYDKRYEKTLENRKKHTIRRRKERQEAKLMAEIEQNNKKTGQSD